PAPAPPRLARSAALRSPDEQSSAQAEQDALGGEHALHVQLRVARAHRAIDGLRRGLVDRESGGRVRRTRRARGGRQVPDEEATDERQGTSGEADGTHAWSSSDGSSVALRPGAASSAAGYASFIIGTRATRGGAVPARRVLGLASGFDYTCAVLERRGRPMDR